MCNCNSIWKTTAINYAAANQNTPTGIVANYLLVNNRCGRDNGAYMEDLILHLHAQGLNYTREQFQHSVLIPLKQEGFIVSLPYPGQSPGIFIPCNEDEIKLLARQTLNRIESEIGNIEAICRRTSFGGQVTGIHNTVTGVII